MDRKKMEKQAQVLRNKRMAGMARRTPPSNTKGHVRLINPLPRKPKDVDMNPPAAASVRRMKAERLLQQRKNIQARREGDKPVNNEALIVRSLPLKGCSGCGRKKR